MSECNDEAVRLIGIDIQYPNIVVSLAGRPGDLQLFLIGGQASCS
jgi:hypothetical protein